MPSLWSAWLLYASLSHAGSVRSGEWQGGAKAVCLNGEALGEDLGEDVAACAHTGSNLLQRHSKFTRTRPANATPLQGFYLTRPANAAKRKAIEALVADERARVAVQPFIAVDEASDSHRTRVHKAHMEILSSCMKYRSAAKCLVLEDDAVWPAGRLGALVRRVAREQGPRSWDLLMLGMGNGKNLSREEMARALRPRGRRRHSMRVSGTLCGCHAYVVNGRRSLQKVSRLLAHRAYRRKEETRACVENLPAEMLARFGVRVVSTRYAFARQESPFGGPSVYRWRF